MLRESWAVLVVLIAVIGSIYDGIVTVNEAAAVGACFTLFLALLRRRLSWGSFLHALGETATNTAAIYLIIFGASIFSYFFTISGAPQVLETPPSRADRSLGHGRRLARYGHSGRRRPAGVGEHDRVLSADVFARMGASDAHDADAKHPNMHRTRSIDCIVLLSGRVKLILDEEETILEPFDVVIQHETNHAWGRTCPTSRHS